jgi:hypothetical protein
MNFSQLSEAAKTELGAVLSDEFCYCGCPHTLAQCLQSHSGCRHAKRAAALAAARAQSGAFNQDIILELSKYYQSFREARRPVKVDEKMCRPAKGKVTVVEYSDFECPHCVAARAPLEELAKKRESSVRVCYAPFPLEGHSHAFQAATAALYARDKGKFWAMHDALFDQKAQLSVPLILELAGKVGLNAKELSKAIESGRYRQELQSWKESGKAAGVEATPSIFFSGRKYNLPIDFASLSHSLADEVEWMDNRGAWAAD